MRILIGVLGYRINNEVVRRLLTQQYDHPMDLLICAGDDAKIGESRFRAITRKYQSLREKFLSGSWDALLTVEDDMYLPPDALARLVDCESDVAYGLYVWRYESQHWLSAHPKLREDPDSGEFQFWSISHAPDMTRKLWGQRVKVEGLGLGCTLIRRHVMNAIPFRQVSDGACADTYFAIDCQAAGFTQVCDTGAICGHRRSDGRIVWPDINEPELYRLD